MCELLQAISELQIHRHGLNISSTRVIIVVGDQEKYDTTLHKNAIVQRILQVVIEVIELTALAIVCGKVFRL